MVTNEMILVIFFGTLIAAFAGYQIWWHMKYEKVRSAVKDDAGVVTDMKYTPSRTHSNGKHTSTTPAKHRVYIKFKTMGDEDFNDVELYETVRLDDEITAKYVEVWKVEKQNPASREFTGYEIISVTSPKGRIVEL